MTRKLLFLALVFAFATPAAMAGGGYVGAGVGQAYQKTEDTDTSFSLDESTTGWKVFLGYDFLKFFGLEASYVDFGTVEGQSSGVKVETDATAYDVFAVGKIPIAFVEPFAKIGYASIDSSASVAGVGSADDTSWEVAYGVGVGFNFSKLHLRLEYEQYDISPDYDGTTPNSDLYMISASAAFKF